MELPPIINEIIRKRLRKKALDTQNELGRGCWVTTEKKGGLAIYVSLNGSLRKLFDDGRWLDLNELLEAVNSYDPTQQMVIVFSSESGLHHIAIVDIEEGST